MQKFSPWTTTFIIGDFLVITWSWYDPESDKVRSLMVMLQSVPLSLRSDANTRPLKSGCTAPLPLALNISYDLSQLSLKSSHFNQIIVLAMKANGGNTMFLSSKKHGILTQSPASACISLTLMQNPSTHCTDFSTDAPVKEENKKAHDQSSNVRLCGWICKILPKK